MLDLESSVCEVGVGAELQAAVIKTIPTNKFPKTAAAPSLIHMVLGTKR